MPRTFARRSSAVLLALAASLPFPDLASGQATRAGDTSTFVWVDTVFAAYAGDVPGCTVGAARHGRPLFVRSYGMADLDARRPAEPSTAYDIASIAKQFTAMGVVLLAQDGTLSLDDDVRRWVPELPDYGRAVTLRHLLTHTSGIRDHLSLLAMQRGGSPEVHDADALDVVVRQRELNFPPGTDWSYSNSNYVLLAEVARRASGRTLPELVRARVLAPLGMRATGFATASGPVAGQAVGYARAGSGWVPGFVPVFTTGDGHMVSTVDDLLRWAEGLRTGAVGGRRAVEAMETVATLPDGSPTGYALGLRVGAYRGVRSVSHGGSGGGFRSELVRFPAQELAIAVLCNASTAPANVLARRVADRLLQPELAAAAARQPSPAAPPPAVRADDLARFAGAYVGRSGELRIFRIDSGALRLHVPPSFVRTLVPLAGARARDPEAPVTFHFTPEHVRQESAGERPEVFRYAGPVDDAPLTAARYAGRYESRDLGVTWDVRVGDDGALRVAHGGPRSPEQAERVFRDGFLMIYGLMQFVTDCRGDVVGFTVADGRVYALRFDRVGSARPPAGCPR